MAALYFVAILGEADHHGAAWLIGEPKRSGYLQERSSFAPDYSSQQVVLLGLHCSSQSLSRYKRDPWLHLEKSDSIFEWSNIWVKGLYHGSVRKWETREAFIIVTGSLVRTHARWDSNPVSRKNIECIWNIVLDFAPVFIGGMTIAIFTTRSKDSTLLSQNHLEFRKYDYVLIIYLERSLIYCHCQLQKPTPKHKLHYCIWKDLYPQELSLCSQCEGCSEDGILSHRKICQ